MCFGPERQRKRLHLVFHPLRVEMGKKQDTAAHRRVHLIGQQLVLPPQRESPIVHCIVLAAFSFRAVALCYGLRWCLTHVLHYVQIVLKLHEALGRSCRLLQTPDEPPKILQHI